MKRTNRRLVLCCILLAGVLAFIWGNSAMPGETSGALSGWLGNLLSKIAPVLATENGLHYLRKAAHFSEFAALGITLTWLFGMLLQPKLLQFGFPLFCGALAAGIDETIQIFSPGRYCSIFDVLIDCSGVLTGILILWLFTWFLRKMRHKKAAI